MAENEYNDTPLRASSQCAPTTRSVRGKRRLRSGAASSNAVPWSTVPWSAVPSGAASSNVASSNVTSSRADVRKTEVSMPSPSMQSVSGTTAPREANVPIWLRSA